jgi:ferredoxin
MNAFRGKFERMLRAQKAKDATWTRSFTWGQVMKIFDAAWGEDGDHYKACGVHGSCMRCEIEELQDRMSGIRSEMDELRQEVADVAGRLVRSDARRGDEGGDS